MARTERFTRHWPEYLIEAWALGTFMVSAGVFTVLIDAPGSTVRELISSDGVRRALIGAAMGLTAVGLIYSPWGKRSGAHMNPAVTLSFLALGRVRASDAGGYVAAQFAGGLLGVLAVIGMLGEVFTAPPVSLVQTVPGPDGVVPAFALEASMAFVLMTMILLFSNRPRLAPYTGFAAGIAIACYITFEAPFSGMSINPARTFASAAPTGSFEHLWLYFTAPTLGMLLAALVYTRRGRVHCAKLIHADDVRCIHCGYEPPGVAAAHPHPHPGGDAP